MPDEIKDKVIDVNLEDELKTSFISYAMAVIINRALPDVRDGLKPVHRRILYDMQELGMTSDKPFRKSARIVGDVLGKYHPHGDTSVYDAMVRLAQKFSIRYLLVDGQGNFGSVDGDGAAAMRYTEARMTKLANYLIGDIGKDTVDFYPNFDETLLQPKVLPSRYPNLLVNGSSGIAVGMATNIPPHNLREVIDGTIHLIDNPDAELDELMQFIKGPDFPTGGIILGKSGIREAYHTGRGKIYVRAKTNIEPMTPNRDRIVVNEIPYLVNKSKLIQNIAALVHTKRIETISDIRDESDRTGMRIVIELKRDANAQVVLNYLYKHTQLQETFGANMLALVNDEPKVLNLHDMLYYYILHQKEVVTRRTKYDLNKAEARSHIIEGLLRALDHIDDIVNIIKASPDVSEARASLMERYSFSEKQAQAILDMRLARLTGLEKDKLQKEFDALQETISYLNSILADESILLTIIKDELTEIRDKFGDDRRTQFSIIDGEIDIEDLIDQEDMVVTLTHFGYIKRTSKSTYRSQNRGGKGVSAMSQRDEDYAEQIHIINTHDNCLFFTNRGRVYTLRCYQIPESNRTARGTAIVNLLPLESNEKVTAIVNLSNDVIEEERYFVMVTKNGTIKRSSLDDFRNLRKSGLIAVTLRDDDELVSVEITEGKSELLLGTRNGKAIHFAESDIRVCGRTSIGVRAIRLAKDDYVISAVTTKPDVQVLNITTNGYGKRTLLKEYRLQNRGGKGIAAMKLTKKTGLLAAQKLVSEDEDLLLLTNDGTLIRTAVDSIRTCGRTTQGVRLMRVADEIEVIDVACAEKEEIVDTIVDNVEETVEVDETENNDSEVSNTENQNEDNSTDPNEI